MASKVLLNLEIGEAEIQCLLNFTDTSEHGHPLTLKNLSA